MVSENPPPPLEKQSRLSLHTPCSQILFRFTHPYYLHIRLYSPFKQHTIAPSEYQRQKGARLGTHTEQNSNGRFLYSLFKWADSKVEDEEEDACRCRQDVSIV